MDQYIEEAKSLLLQYFEPEFSGNLPIHLTTLEVYKTLKGIVPSGIFNEHDVYDILIELGFSKDLQTFYKKDEDGKETNEVSYQLFMWLLYKK